MPFPTISHRQSEAVERGPHGRCATCPHPEPTRPGDVPPGTYTLRFFEFKTYLAVQESERAHGQVIEWQYQRIPATSVVYVFRRVRGRTRLIATLRGAGANGTAMHATLTVRPEDGPVEVFACLSHFALPEARLAQFTSADGLAALRRRCVRFCPSDRHHVRPAGGTTYDVVLPDWRRIAIDLHVIEGKRLNEAQRVTAGIGADGKANEAVHQLLAELTLVAARGYAKTEPKAWTYLRHISSKRRRLPGMSASEPLTGAESYLIYRRARIAGAGHKAEVAAASKYEWMSRPGYREMRWDALTDPHAQAATVIKEAKLLATAPQTEQGRAFIRRQAVDPGSWYGHYLWNMRAADSAAVRARDDVREAYLVLLTVVGTTLLTEAAPEEEDHTPELAENAKHAVIGASGVPQIPVHRAGVHTANTDRRLRTYERVEQRTAERRHMQATLDEARKVAEEAHTRATHLPGWVIMRQRVWASIRRAFGYAPRLVDYNPVTAKFVPRSLAPTQLAPSVREEARTNAQAEVNREAHRAQRAKAAAEQAYGGTEAKRTAQIARSEHLSERFETKLGHAKAAYLDASRTEHALAEGENADGRRVAMGGRFPAAAQMAFMVLNLAYSLHVLRGKHGVHEAWRAVGAGAEVGAATAFVASRTLADLERLHVENPEHGGGAGHAKLVGVKTWLGAARVCAFLAAYVTTRDAYTEANEHAARGELGLTAASAIATAGGVVLMTGAAADGAAVVLGEAALPMLAAPGVDILGALLLLLAAGATWYYGRPKPALQQWLLDCPWGTSSEAPELTDEEQIQRLLEIIATPEITAKEIMFRGKRCVRATIRPPIFLPHRSSLRCALYVSKYTGDADFYPHVTETEAVEIGTLDDATAAKLLLGPVRLPVHGEGTTITHVVARRSEGSLVFDVDYPLGRRIATKYTPNPRYPKNPKSPFAVHSDPSRPEISEGKAFHDFYYYMSGDARLELWPAEEDATWGKIELAPFKLGPASITGSWGGRVHAHPTDAQRPDVR